MGTNTITVPRGVMRLRMRDAGAGHPDKAIVDYASAATEARPRAGERVRMQVARGWHRPWPLRLGGGDSDDLFVPRGGWRPARVLTEHDPENAAFLVVVDAAGRVWRMVNPACVRADVAVVAEPRVLVIEAEDGDRARVVASHLIAAGYWTELVRDGARYEVRTLASREQLACTPAWARRGAVLRYVEREARS